LRANKYDAEIEKIRASTERWKASLQLASTIVGYTAAVVALWIIMDSLQSFFTHDTEVIVAMTNLIDKINISNITGYFLAALATIAWRIERNGKKRAIEEKGKYQRLVEKKDASRSSSGLDATGDNPEKKK